MGHPANLDATAITAAIVKTGYLSVANAFSVPCRQRHRCQAQSEGINGKTDPWE